MEQHENGERSEAMGDVKGYFYLIWSWRWSIVLAGLVAAVVAFAVSIQVVPIYEASTRLLVSAPSAIGGNDPTSLVTTQTMTTTYSEMVLERPVLQGVIDELKLDTTPEDLKKVISVDMLPNTQLLVIKVQDPDPKRAADICNALASVFANRIGELQARRFSASREGLAKQVADMERQITTTSAEIAALEQQIAAATQTVVPPDTSALLQLQARLTQYRTIYSSLVTSFEQVRLSEEQTSSNVVVSEPAAIETEPVRPKTILNTVLALVAGMLLGTGALLAIDRLDDSIKDPEEIRRKFNVPILGMITRHESPPGQPIALFEPRSPTAEAFRVLRTSIMYAAVDQPLRRLMITSPTPEDGKTTVACSLAVVFSMSEKLVVLLDADMRRPQVHEKFGLHNRLGLSTLFVLPVEMIASVIQSSALSPLAVITSGRPPPNPSELLISDRMGQILDGLNRVFEVIVIDTPPVLTVTDATALARTVDGVVLVVKPGTTKLSDVQQALEQLRAANARVLGVVLNDVDPGSRKYGYHYARYYSRYYEAGERTAVGSKKRTRRSARQTLSEPDAAAPPAMKGHNP